MKYYKYAFLICLGLFSPVEGRLMINREAYASIVGYADTMRNYPSYDDSRYPDFDGRDVNLEPLEWRGGEQYLRLSITLWHMGRLSAEKVAQTGFLGLLSQFYPKKVYDVSRNNFRHTEDHQVYQELFFSKDGKICELEDLGFHLRIVERNRGHQSVAFYDASGKPCPCLHEYHRGDVLVKGDAVIKETFFDTSDEPVDISRPAVFPLGNMIHYHQYKATPAFKAGVVCREVHKGWEAEVTSSGRKTFYLKGRFGDFNDECERWLYLPEDLLRSRYYLEPYDMAEAEYTDKFGRLTRGLQGWARRCVDHYEPESDLGGGRAVKEIRYYDENGELSSDHLMKCAIIRFSYPEHGFQQISYFDEHGRELKHFQKAREGPLEKEEPYSYYSMLNEDVTCYEPDNRDEGEIIEREAD